MILAQARNSRGGGALQADRDRYFQNEAVDAPFRDVRLVVFDLNGLILDDEPLQIAAVNGVLEAFGIHFDEESWTKRFFGHRSADYFAEIMGESGRSADTAFIKMLVARKDRRYRDLLRDHLHDCVLPGVLKFVGYLSERAETSLALATSASREELESVMGSSGLGIFNLFRYVVCGEDVATGKPDPETYLRILSLSGAAPSSVLVLEDSSLGVRSAVGAGLRVLAVPNRFTASQDFTGAHMIISDLTPEARKITPGE